MSIRLVALALALFSSASYAVSTRHAVEAKLNFVNQLEVDAEEFRRIQEEHNVSDNRVVNHLLERQVTHMFGALAHNGNFQGVPKTDHAFTVSKVDEISDKVKIDYSYEGTVLVSGDVGAAIEFFLPVNPLAVYEQGVGQKAGEPFNYCTDEHYQSEGDFWYFWNPEQPRCRLKAERDYRTVSGQLTHKRRTTDSYPEYERLVQNRADEKVIPIALFFGLDEPTNTTDLDDGKPDANKENVRSTITYLREHGFSEVTPQIPVLATQLIAASKSLYRWFSKDTERAQILVKVYYGATGINELDNFASIFHSLYLDSVRDDSVMVYNGHSGLGGHLDVDTFYELYNRFELREQYQIYFFNSCSSYPYYNQMYFDRKPGKSRNLDIVTNGLEVYFDDMDEAVFTFLSAIESWAQTGESKAYADIAEEADSDNLLAVVGDEDNPQP